MAEVRSHRLTPKAAREIEVQAFKQLAELPPRGQG